MKRPIGIRLEDVNAERVRQSHHDAITELQAQPSTGERTIAGIELADSVATPIAHGLGRAPTFFSLTPPQGATATGRIIETRTGVDRTKFIVLTATGWGATITQDMAVR